MSHMSIIFIYLQYPNWLKLDLFSAIFFFQVEWKDLGGHSYSGIFKGATNGYVRLSLAKEPVTTVQETAPGMGLKFLRDGIDSANLVAMYSVNGQDSWNFFKNDFTTHIGKAELELIPLILKFSEATNYVMEVQI